MAKTKISELDAAAANNTDINSVDVSEGCAPSGINNAIREMGAMLKRMDNGTDHLTNPNITGDLDVDNININGNTISTTSGDMTLDAVGDVVIDADGGDVNFKDGGTSIAYLSNSSGTLLLGVNTSDADFKVQGNDGGSTINALTLDMSEAGAATFNAGATFNGDVKIGDSDSLVFGDGLDLQIVHNGSNSFITDAGTGDMYIRGDNSLFIQKLDGTENKAQFITDGAVNLMHDGTTRFSTTAVGIAADQMFGIGDGDTGIALGANGADIMQFYTGNTERVNIDASGVIGNLNGRNSAGIISSKTSITVGDDSSVTIVDSSASQIAGRGMLLIYETSGGSGGTFTAGFGSATLLNTTNNFGTGADFVVGDTDNNFCVIVSGHEITFKNRIGSSRAFHIQFIGAGIT